MYSMIPRRFTRLRLTTFRREGVDMSTKHVQKKIEWTPEDRERRRKARELFKGKPTIDELVASGELSGNTVPMSLYVQMQQLLHDLKKAREGAGLSLADI